MKLLAILILALYSFFNINNNYIILSFLFLLIKIESQTKGLLIPNIRSKKLLVKLIDTQGFGDTGGISEDDKITLAIKDDFMNELTVLDK